MKVAIAGYGVEGKANFVYWRDRIRATVTILDEQPVDDAPSGVALRTGESAFDDLSEFDVVVRTASLRPSRLKGAKKITSSTKEFFDACPAPIIGVTGTKGKGTTSSLIASILRAAQKNVHLVGNIGTAALEVLPEVKSDDIVVYELSSFQLWDLMKSPETAVVLMIEPDHLDVHMDFDEYVAAKANITLHQLPSDRVVYYERNQYASHIAHASQGEQIPYPGFESAYVKDGFFWYNEQKLCSVSSLKIPGKHNLDNACAAIAASWRYIDGHIDSIGKGLEDFEGLPHRLKFVAEKDGVKYYDDSIATTIGSAVAAIASFSVPMVVILGGSSKGVGYDGVVEACKQADATIVAIGQTGKEIYKLAKQKGVKAIRVPGGMSEVVQAAAKEATNGGVVILSPASASFDQYSGYVDRGDQFIAAVEAL